MKNLFHSGSEEVNPRFIWQQISNAPGGAPAKTPEEIANAAINALEEDYPTIENDKLEEAQAAYDAADALKIDGNTEQEANLAKFAEKLKAAEVAASLLKLQDNIGETLLKKLGINIDEMDESQKNFSKLVLNFLVKNMDAFADKIKTQADMDAFADKFSKEMQAMSGFDPENPDYGSILTQFESSFESFTPEASNENEEQSSESKEAVSYDLKRVLQYFDNMGKVMDGIKDDLLESGLEINSSEYNKKARDILISKLTEKIQDELGEWVKKNRPARDKSEENRRRKELIARNPNMKTSTGRGLENIANGISGIFTSEYGNAQFFESGSILKQVFSVDEETDIINDFFERNIDPTGNPEVEAQIKDWLEKDLMKGPEVPFSKLHDKFRTLNMDPNSEQGKEDIELLIEKMKTVSREYVGGEWESKYETYVKNTGPEALDFGEWIDKQEISTWDRLLLLFRKLFTTEDGEFSLTAFLNKKKENIEERDSIERLTELIKGKETKEGIQNEKDWEAIKEKNPNDPILLAFENFRTEHVGLLDVATGTEADYRNVKVEDFKTFNASSKLQNILRWAHVKQTEGKAESLSKGNWENLIEKEKSFTLSPSGGDIDADTILTIKNEESGDEKEIKSWTNNEFGNISLEKKEVNIPEPKLEILDGGTWFNDRKYNDVIQELRTKPYEDLSKMEKRLYDLLQDDNVKYFIKQLRNNGVHEQVGNKSGWLFGRYTGEMRLDLLDEIEKCGKEIDLKAEAIVPIGKRIVATVDGREIRFHRFRYLKKQLEKINAVGGAVNTNDNESSEEEIPED